MKKILFLAGFSCISIVAAASYFEIERKILCSEAQEVITSLTQEHEEVPIWHGTVTDKVNAALFVNPKTTTWTFFVTDSRVICILNTGKGFSYRPNLRGTSI